MAGEAITMRPVSTNTTPLIAEYFKPSVFEYTVAEPHLGHVPFFILILHFLGF
jgi:hypothetical protein